MNTRLVSLINMLCTLTPCSLGQAATDGAIEGSEKRLGVRFPSQLKVWLKTFNGMRAPPGNFYGISPNSEGDCIEEMMERDFPDYRSRKWIPVAGDGCGNHYVIPYGADIAPILFVATTACHDAAAYVVASDLAHFLELVFEHEIRICKGDVGAFTPDWPFDEQFVRERDPQIARFNSVPLPWETKNRKPSSSKVKIKGQRKTIKTADAAITLSKAVIALLQEIYKDARCRILGKATEAAFRRVEKRQQYVIPDDLRTWLLHFNGVQIGTSGLLGVETWDNDDLNMEEIVSIRYTDIGRQHLWPIATDSPGCYYVMPTTEERHPVLFLDTALPQVSPQYIVASDLSHFLESFLRRELARLHQAPSSDDMNWPFNERHVRTCDPEIERYHDVPLPWQRV